MSLQNRLTASFLLVALLFLAQVGVTLWNNQKLGDLVEEAIDKNQTAASQLSGLALELQKLRRYEKEYFIYIADAGKKRHYEYEWTASLRLAASTLDDLILNAGGLFAEQDLARFGEWKQALEFYAAEFFKVMKHYQDLRLFEEKAEQARAMHSVEANNMITDGKNALAAVMEGAEVMARERTRESIDVVEDIEVNFTTVKWLSLSLAGTAFVIALALVILVPGSLNRGLQQLREAAERISRNDLSRPLADSGVQELDALGRALERIRVARLGRTQSGESS